MKHYYIHIAAILLLASCSGRVKGPCDIYEEFGTECVAAHSTTRKLYSKYNGPLYQVIRDSDGKTLDIGTIDGGYADAAAEGGFRSLGGFFHGLLRFARNDDTIKPSLVSHPGC